MPKTSTPAQPTITNNIINQPLGQPFQTNGKYLQDYRQTIASLMSEVEEIGEIVRLAYCNEDQVLIDEDGLYLLQKHSTTEVSFMGFVGLHQTAKNLVIDIILSLSSNPGNHFTNVYGQTDGTALYLWSLPFSPNSKQKTFLLSYSGIPLDQTSFERKHQILLDLMLTLCSSVAVMLKNKRIFSDERYNYDKESWLRVFSYQIQKSSKRIINQQWSNKRQDPLWPRSLCVFQPFKPDNESIQAFQQEFANFMFMQTDSPLLNRDQPVQELLLSLNQPTPKIDPSFVKQISSFFIDEIRRTTANRYQDLKMTGNILCKLLINSVKYMNKKSTLKIHKIFNSIFKQLYEASLLYHSQNYTAILESQFSSQEPMPYDTLLDILGQAEQMTMTSFNQNIINEAVHQPYEQEMLDLIEEKEQMLIEVNFKKTKHIISDKITILNKTAKFQPQHIKQYLLSLKDVVQEHDHHPIQVITHKLDKYSNNLQKRIIQQKLKEEKQIMNGLKKQIKQTYQEYKVARDENDEIRRDNQSSQKAHKKLLRQAYQLQNKIRNTKKDIEHQKKFQKEYMMSKESKKDVAESLLETVRELQEQVRDNQKQMDQIKKDFDYHPEILALNKQIQERQREIKALEKNQSKMYSQMGQSQMRQSQVRTAVHKVVEGAPQRRTIKRVTAKTAKK